MPTPIASVLGAVVELLNGTTGLSASLAEYSSSIQMTGIPQAQGIAPEAPIAEASYVPQEVEELQTKVVYPLCRVYCDQIKNDGKVKFRKFSGSYRVVVEITHSKDRLDGLSDTLQAAVDAVGEVYDKNQGNLADGMVLLPGYEVQVDAVRKGGMHYLQKARVISQLSWER